MEGFKIFSENSCIRTDVNMAGTFKLMAYDDFEIFESSIHSGRSIICQPGECEDSLNVCYVLSGKLYHSNTKSYILPGEYYTFKDLKHTHHLSVVEETKLLMIRKKGEYLNQVAKTNDISKIVHKIQEKDCYTEEHCNRTGNLTVQIAVRMDLPEDTINHILFAGKIHDVGKIEVPINILNKPGKLDKEEFDCIKRHPEYGYDIVKKLIGDEKIAKIILQHHEKIDGSGYPLGLKGEEIEVEARILLVADSFDAMTSDRPYHKAFTNEEAIEELIKYSNVWYDENIVNTLIEVIKK